jgi:hypothetical protein
MTKYTVIHTQAYRYEVEADSKEDAQDLAYEHENMCSEEVRDDYEIVPEAPMIDIPPSCWVDFDDYDNWDQEVYSAPPSPPIPTYYGKDTKFVMHGTWGYDTEGEMTEMLSLSFTSTEDMTRKEVLTKMSDLYLESVHHARDYYFEGINPYDRGTEIIFGT